MAHHRQNRVRTGRIAEYLVGQVYEETLGFKVLSRNLRVGPYEIDLFVQKADAKRIVEVRSTGCRNINDLAWSLVGRKSRALRRAIREMLRRGLLETTGSFQVDAALVRWNAGAPPTVDIWYDILPGDLGV